MSGRWERWSRRDGCGGSHGRSRCSSPCSTCGCWFERSVLPEPTTMYRHILVAIEHAESDAAILRHVERLARLTGASLLLVHVADGFAARHFDDLKLRESEEIRSDRAYLEGLKDALTAE